MVHTSFHFRVFLALLIGFAATAGLSTVSVAGDLQTKAEPAQKQRTIKRAPTTRSQVIRRVPLNYDTKLQIIKGSNEFVEILEEMVVYDREQTRYQWSTDKTNAASGFWEVKNLTSGGDIVRTGNTSSAPAPGEVRFFTLPADYFLLANTPSTDTTFEITIKPYDSSNAPLGGASNPVRVIQRGTANRPPPTVFGDGANFPSIEIISYEEKIGQVTNTQLFYAYADVKLRASNKTTINLKPGAGRRAATSSSTGLSVQTGRTAEAARRSTGRRIISSTNKKTDPMFVSVKDHSLLFRQAAPVSVPALNPGATMDVNIRLDAILPPPKSQTPQAQQHREWRRSYADRCGPELRGVLDWRGNQSQTPLDAHRESLLAWPGWADYTKVSPSAAICDSTQCVKLCEIEKSIRQRLDGRTVGYAYVVGGTSPKFGAGGKARTSADGTAIDFTSKTPITVASVSKWITALGVMSTARQNNNVDIDDAIGPFLPDEWNVGNYFQNVTIAQFLGQSSGIKDYGNINQNYASLRAFFEQPVNNSWMAGCTGSGVMNPPNAVNPSAAMTRCYSNYNFAIFRLLLPQVAGLPVDGNLTTRPQTLANQYEQLIRQNVFERVGQTGTGCRPRGAEPHAFAYKFPGDTAGFDWGDVRLRCGDAGWYVSAEDMAKVLFSINQKDGRILFESGTASDLDDMRIRGLGLDVFGATELEKNGAWGGGGGLITSTAAIFGPVSGPNVIGVLFINSEISGGPNDNENARNVLEDAYNAALYPK